MGRDALDAIADLVASDEPLGWAHDHLTLVGAGDRASVFAHPTDPDLVVRVTDYPDGWFGYARDVSLLGEGSGAARHGPGMVAMASVGDGHWVAICERLSRIGPDDEALARAVTLARRLYATGLPEVELAELGGLQPLLPEFLSLLPRGMADLRDDNWLARGRHLVLNDPRGSLRFDEEARLRTEIAPARGPAP